MIIYTKTSTIQELQEILELQKKNLPINLSDNEKKEQGFVTVKHSLEILKKMNDECPHTVAKHNNKIIGYALSMTKTFSSDIEVLRPMFNQIAKVVTTENYIIMGQICIDKKYRKLGIFKGLYNYMKNNICKNNFDLIITEIDLYNVRSLKAHKFTGFLKLKDYQYGNKNWRIVSLKV